ncbi:MAG: hypothetical protein Q9168_008098, partial [Polycauliona sp. 1 TL-2023]
MTPDNYEALDNLIPDIGRLNSRTILAQSSARLPAGHPSANTTVSLGQIKHDLGRQLSPKADIYLPGNDSYVNATTRWNGAMHPDFAAVVVPANDEDVAATVKYANKHNIPFLAVNRGHGASLELNNLRHGISINLFNLDSIVISADNRTAVLGGGVYADPLIRTLAKSGKTAATTSVRCVGFGSGLGGGMGLIQGQFGLVADNIVSMSIVTATGAIVTANDRQNADLFWAMRGAGHNFGIVTSYVYKIHGSIPTWYAASYVYKPDKLEAVFQALNKISNDGKQPKELNLYAVYVNNPSISDKPVIIVSIYYAGSSASAHPYTLPFLALNPISTTNQTLPFTELADSVGLGTKSPACKSGMGSASFPVGLRRYNATANRQVYNLYTDLVTRYPEFKNSVVQFEGYAMQGVQAVDAASTAYPHRGDNLLV